MDQATLAAEAVKVLHAAGLPELNPLRDQRLWFVRRREADTSPP
jgi:hypothetical protein